MRLINGDAVKKKIKKHIDINVANDLDTGWNLGLETAIYEIDNEPTIEDTSRPQGEWITKGYEPFGRCNICDAICEINNFCGHCGAEMRKEGAE